MSGTGRHWGARTLAHLFAVLVLALFAFSPSLEAAACALEPNEPVQVVSDGKAQASAPTAPDQAPDDIDQHACPHGHCHQAAALVGDAHDPGAPPRLAAQPGPAATIAGPADASLRSSRTPSPSLTARRA